MRTVTTFVHQLLIAVMLLAAPAAAAAQQAILEGHAGRVWFLDDAPIPHIVAGGSARLLLTPRLAIGPDVTHMRGPGRDRDWFFTANLTYDIGPLDWRVRPFVIVGAGYMHTTLDIPGGTFSGGEAGLTYGGGVRIMVSDRWFVAPQYRQGWEPHAGVMVSVGLFTR